MVTDTDSDGLNDAEEVCLIQTVHLRIPMAMGLLISRKLGYHTYEQINSSLTWSAANADAESRGGYLATITSLEEKTKWKQSGLPIPGGRRTLKPKVPGNGSLGTMELYFLEHK